MMEWLILCSDTASAAVRVLVCFLIMHRAAAGKSRKGQCHGSLRRLLWERQSFPC